MYLRKIFFLVCVLCAVGLNVSGQTTIELDNSTVEVTTLTQGLYVPWELAWGPDNQLWMTERDGAISKVDPETGEVTELLVLSDNAEIQESGLLGMSLHPDFAAVPQIFFVYTYFKDGDLTEKLVRYTYNAANETLEDEFILIDDIPAIATHNGSRLCITPDLKILMSTGDVQDASSSQNLNALTGKFLRLNLDGSIPEDNPFGPASPVFSLGHRNAQGIVLADNGYLYSSEHGPVADDELNILEMGRNFGWPDVSGFCNNAVEFDFCESQNVAEPLVTWTPTIAPAGIDFYDHPGIPDWQNSVLMAVLKSQDFRVMQLNDAGTAVIGGESNGVLNEQYGRMRDICVAPDGRIFVSTSNNDAYGNPAMWGSDKILELKSDIEINNYPKANFIMQGDGLGTYVFKNLSLNATSYEWDFGDGNTSTEANPTHSFVESDTYTIKLTVSNDDYSVQKQYTLYIATILPNAEFEVATNCFEVTFNNASNNATSYEWDFGDGNTSTETSPGHTYAQAGMYTVQLIAQTNDLSDTLTQEISVLCDTMSAINPINVLEVKVYPNPTNNKAIVQTPFGQQAIQAYLYNAQGEILRTIQPNLMDGRFVIEASNLGSGLYFIVVKNADNTQFTSKLIVE